MPYADLSVAEIDTEALRVIPEAEARLADAAAFAKTAKVISLAVHNPNNPALGKLCAELQTRGYTLQEYLVSKKSLDKAFARYADLSFAVEERAGILTIAPEVRQRICRGYRIARLVYDGARLDYVAEVARAGVARA